MDNNQQPDVDSGGIAFMLYTLHTTRQDIINSILGLSCESGSQEHLTAYAIANASFRGQLGLVDDLIRSLQPQQDEV